MAPSALFIGSLSAFPHSVYCAVAPGAAVSQYYPQHKDNKAARNCIRSFGLFATSNSIMGLIADKEIKADKPRAAVYGLTALLCALNGSSLLDGKRSGVAEGPMTDIGIATCFGFALLDAAMAVNHWKKATEKDKPAAASTCSNTKCKCGSSCKCGKTCKCGAATTAAKKK